MRTYLIARRLFRRIVPDKARAFIWRHHRTAVGKRAIQLKSWLEQTATHDDIYDSEYYRSVEDGAARSAAAIATSIITDFDPSSVIDVGCGTGAILNALRTLGVIKVVGLEHSVAAIRICREKDIPVVPFDLESEVKYDDHFDLVLSTEVAEHLRVECADAYVDMLCALGPVIVITAATPGQAGTDHVNEQPHEFWIAKFTARSFAISTGITSQWRDQWRAAGAAGCYWRNVMVFEKVV
jgi:SAM-dependent methyltransferase